MPTSSRTARFARAGRLLTSPRLTAVLLAGCAAGAGAQAPTPPADPWSIDAQYLQLAPTGTRRAATPSLALTIGRRLAEGGLEWRGDAGWSRAVHGGTTAQGITLGLSAGVPVRGVGARRILLRPGLAVLAGWAESQDSSALYDWRGVAGSPDAGTSGSQFTWSTVRGRTIGVGGSLGAEMALTRSVGVAASIRQWRLGGRAATANPNVTLVGIGVSAQPRALARDVRRLWRSERDARTPQAAGDGTSQDANAARAALAEAGR